MIFWANKGEDDMRRYLFSDFDGIKVNDPVIYGNALVGVIREVNANTSTNFGAIVSIIIKDTTTVITLCRICTASEERLWLTVSTS